MRRERRKQTKGSREQRDAILLWSHWKDKQVHYNVSKSAVWRFNITKRPQNSAHASVCRDTLQCDCVLWTGLIRTLLLEEVMLSKNENGSKFIFFFHAQIRFRLTLMLHVCRHTFRGFKSAALHKLDKLDVECTVSAGYLYFFITAQHAKCNHRLYSPWSSKVRRNINGGDCLLFILFSAMYGSYIFKGWANISDTSWNNCVGLKCRAALPKQENNVFFIQETF